MIMVDKINLKSIKRKHLNQNGQAVFEMILFIPFLLFLYTIYYTIGNSISGSINQQKAVRGYFYSLVKGNSYIVNLNDLKGHKQKSVNRVGFNAIGWNEKLDNEVSIAPCFKFSSVLKNSTTEECESDQRDEERSSRYIRLFTFYGVCGPHYLATQDKVDGKDFFDIDPHYQGISESCRNMN